MQTRPTLLAILALVGLAACVPGLPSAPAAAPLGLEQFPDDEPGQAAPVVGPVGSASGAPSGPTPPGATPPAGASPSAAPAPESPFSETRYQDAVTTTKFVPRFTLGFDALRAGGEPGVTLDVYQTKGELEVRELRAILENAAFRYDKLSVGLQIGDGQMDVGTPPKISLPVSIKVTQTDGATYAIVAAKASQPLLEVYLSDIRIKQLNGNLSIVSISNLARGNDGHGQHTTEASARVVQRIFPGFLKAPAAPGAMRSRVLIYSEDDPAAGGATALRVHRPTFEVAP